MSDPDERHLEDGFRRRFDIELFVVHPTIDPREITTALGLEASIVHRAGDRRTTPDGAVLEGTYRDTRWRHSIRHEVKDQFFAKKVEEFVNRLVPYREFLHHLRATGGRATLIVQFLGDGYFGDKIGGDTLARMVDLQLDCGVECFTTPQRTSGKYHDRQHPLHPGDARKRAVEHDSDLYTHRYPQAQGDPRGHAPGQARSTARHAK
jgi:hypothetical protein